MWFWFDWALWQKLSFVLAILIALVLIYSFAILIHNRRTTRKRAEAEENEKAEHDAELHPIMSSSADMPFGARALERGIQVEGIWVSNNTTPTSSPHPPSTPAASRPPSISGDSPMKQPQIKTTSRVEKPSVVYPFSSRSKIPETPSSPLAREDNVLINRPESPPHDLSREDEYPQLVATVHNEPLVSNETDMHPSKKSSRSSWITKSPEVFKWKPMSGHPRRGSSEEFRRRMSKLFDENVQASPLEAFQLKPFQGTTTSQETQSNMRPPPPY